MAIPEYQGKVIDEGLNSTKIKTLKITLYTNLLSTNFKNLESSARVE